MSKLLISPLVEQQLPEFIRGDYPVFIKFLEKYYEWMEQTGNMVDEAGNLRFAQDVDLATDEYIQLVQQEFLPFFPESITLDKRKFLKLVSQFYRAKGTPDSVKFLFRALFNEEIDIYYPKDDILITSDGKWVLPLALRIDTLDDNIFNIEKCLIVGQISKATAVVERVIRSIDRQLGISYIELYISNVERLFETGETITSTYNDGITDITVTGRLIGSLSEIKIDPKNRGLFYNAYDVNTGYQGDPVSIVGGLNTNSNTPIGAIAYVGESTKGSITDIVVSDGGFGFRQNVNTSIIDFRGGFDNSTFGTEAQAQISLVDENTARTMNVSSLTIDSILNLNLNQISPTSNAQNTAIANTTTWQEFTVYPISFVTISGGGGGYRNKPSVDVHSFYLENNNDILVVSDVTLVKGSSVITSSSVNFQTYFESGNTVRLHIPNRLDSIRKVASVTTNTLTLTEAFSNDITGVSVYKVLRSDLRNLGSLGRIKITDGGENYDVDEYLTFSGGSGYGASAKITSVHSSNNGIKTVEMVQVPGYIIGGEGYTMSSLPTVGVDTVSGTNAILSVSEIAGDGEKLDLTTSRIGSISKLRVVSYGYDYVTTPTVSLRNADLILENTTVGQLFIPGTKVYQGPSSTSTTFEAMVDKFDVNSGLLRVYDYSGTLNTNISINSEDDQISGNITSVIIYGDGRAKATANFENGLIRLPGLYLNTDGHLSSDKVLQDGRKYHNFSYVISTTQDTDKFKSTLDNIVHPIGTITFVNRIDSNSDAVDYTIQDYRLITETLPITFNVNSYSPVMTSTDIELSVDDSVNVGDLVVVTSLSKQIIGTVNVSSGSNNVVGTDTNFINDVQIGDTIYISSGNTEIVADILDSNTLVTQNVINVSGTNETINLIFDETKTVTFVNTDTIIVDTDFSTNSTFATTLVQKVE